MTLNEGMYLDPETFRLYLKDDSGIPSQAIHLHPDMHGLHGIRVQCIDHWSVRNYWDFAQTLPPDEFFFGTFGIFDSAASAPENSIILLKELRQRAAHENVSYLELMFSYPDVRGYVSGNAALNERLKASIRSGTRSPSVPC
jgi:adenosine deaminase